MLNLNVSNAYYSKNNLNQISFKKTAEKSLNTHSKPLTQADLLREQQERIKKEEKRRNFSMILSIVGVLTSVGILAIFAKGLFTKTPKTVFKKIENMPKLTDDCVNPEAKSFIERCVNLFNKPKELIEHAGVKNRAKMVLFHGKTGTGKTFSAQLLAKELGAEYGEIQFSDLSSEYIGKTAVNITAKFKELATLAKKNPNKKYVVTFNEIDSLINNVEKLGSNNQHLGQNRTSFLNGLDSVKDIPNLIIVGTTNINPHTANLDPATLSRLGQIYEIKPATIKELGASLKYHLKNSPAAQDLIKNEAEITSLAEAIHAKGGVQRDVDNIVNEALETFLGKIDNTNTKFESKYISDIIAQKETWAATIDAKANPKIESLEQYLGERNIFEEFVEFIKGRKGNDKAA